MGRAICGIYEALWLARLHHSSTRALYLHLPFCKRKCAYCDFASAATQADDPLIAAYVTSLERLTHQAEQAGLLRGCQTVYVGGGTPTLAGNDLVRLVSTVRESCPTLVELSCEANPDSLSDALLAALPQAGCSRLSIGVQSLCDAELQALGRIHTAEQARERVAAAVRTGLSVSCDLMCATPQQADESWDHTLEDLLSLGPQHVSIYPLQIEEGTPLATRIGDAPAPWNDPQVQAERMDAARLMLESAGYERYEVASYARTDHECRHNMAYWTAEPYLGIGSRASSMLTRAGYERLRLVAPQLSPLADETTRVRLTCTNTTREFAAACSWAVLSWEGEALDQAQAAAEDLMLAMRMVRGADRGLLEHARHTLGTQAVDDAFAWCELRDLVASTDGSWRPTHEGWLLGNELYGRLWDLAPGEVTEFVSPAAATS